MESIAHMERTTSKLRDSYSDTSILPQIRNFNDITACTTSKQIELSTVYTNRLELI